MTCLFSVTCLEVIATMRNLKKKDQLVEAAGDVYGKTLTLLALDVCSDDSVRQCVDSVKDRHIDVLSECRTPLTSLALFTLQGKSDFFFFFLMGCSNCKLYDQIWGCEKSEKSTGNMCKLASQLSLAC